MGHTAGFPLTRHCRRGGPGGIAALERRSLCTGWLGGGRGGVSTVLGFILTRDPNWLEASTTGSAGSPPGTRLRGDCW